MAESHVAACVWESSWGLGWGSWSPVLQGLLASPMLTQPLLTRARRVPSTRWFEESAPQGVQAESTWSG